LGSVEIASVSVYVVHWAFKLRCYKTKQSENTSGGCLSSWDDRIRNFIGFRAI